MFGRKLVRELAWVLAIKLVALTAIYFLFFASPVRVSPQGQAAASFFNVPQER
jgi:hypothetical protein